MVCAGPLRGPAGRGGTADNSSGGKGVLWCLPRGQATIFSHSLSLTHKYLPPRVWASAPHSEQRLKAVPAPGVSMSRHLPPAVSPCENPPYHVALAFIRSQQAGGGRPGHSPWEQREHLRSGPGQGRPGRGSPAEVGCAQGGAGTHRGSSRPPLDETGTGSGRLVPPVAAQGMACWGGGHGA